MSHEPNAHALPQKVKDWIGARTGRCCGNCHFFKFEDADGLGWCDFLHLETRCNIDACEFHRYASPAVQPDLT